MRLTGCKDRRVTLRSRRWPPKLMDRHHGTTTGWHTSENASNRPSCEWRDATNVVRKARASDAWRSQGTVGGKPCWNCGLGNHVYHDRAEASDFLAPSLAFLDVGTAPCKQCAERSALGAVETDLLEGELWGQTLGIEEMFICCVEVDTSLDNISRVE